MDERRKIGSEPEARRCLAAVKASGLPLKEWARARGIDARSLHAWKMNLHRWSPAGAAARKRAARTVTTKSSKPRLVELVASSSSMGSRYALRIGSASVEFGDDFEAATLRRVIDVLRSC